MFGKDENYIAAQVGLAFDSYELAGGVFFGREQVVEKFARFVSRNVAREKSYRLGIGHADCEGDARQLLELLEDLIPNRHQTIFTQIGAALGVHAGPAALVVGIQEYVPPGQD